MAIFLFWNMNRQPALEELRALADQHRVDMFVLADCRMSDVQLLKGLNTGRAAKFTLPVHRSGLIKILMRYPRNALQPVRDSGRVAIRRLVPPIGQDLIIVAAHLRSKLRQKPSDQEAECRRVAGYIKEAEARVGHKRTVVLGDLNVDPFEIGVCQSDGLHAVMDRATAARGSRVVQGEEYVFFYNPMWSLLGDQSSGPPGSYFYDSGTDLNYYWHTFDQVLVRPQLLPGISQGDVQVLTEAGDIPLLSGIGRPTPSDHLPVLLRLNLEKE